MQTRFGSALAPFLLGLCAAAMLGGCASPQSQPVNKPIVQQEQTAPPDAEPAVAIPAPVSKGCQTTENTEVKGVATQEGQTTSTRTSTVCVTQ